MKQDQAYNVDKQTHTTNNEHQNWIVHYFYFNEPEIEETLLFCYQVIYLMKCTKTGNDEYTF